MILLCVVQQVFVDIWVKREKLQVVSLKAYLFQSARNAALDVLKRKKTESKYLEMLDQSEKELMTD